MKLSEIARKLGCAVEGPQDTEITGVAGIDHAKSGHVTFLANRRYFPLLKTTHASAVLLQAGITLERAPGAYPISALRSENPYLDFARAIEFFISAASLCAGNSPDRSDCKERASGRRRAHRSLLLCGRKRANWTQRDTAQLRDGLPGAKIGADFFAHAHAVVREFCVIGDRVTLQNGVVIGGDGLGFAKRKDGSWYKMAQSGVAVLRTMWKYRRMRAWTELPWAKRASGGGPSWMIWCSWVTPQRLATTRCCVARLVWRAPRKSVTGRFWPGKSAQRGILASVTILWLPPRAEYPMTCLHGPCIRVIPRSRTGNG